MGSDDLFRRKRINVEVEVEPIWKDEDCISVRVRAQELGLELGDGLSVLPRWFETAPSPQRMVHEAEVVSLLKLWRQAGVDVQIVSPQLGLLRENASTWIMPTLFVASSLMTGNPALVSVALGVVSNYLTDLFRGVADPNTVKASVVVEKRDGTCRRISYEGPVRGLEKIESLVKEAFKEDGDREGL